MPKWADYLISAVRFEEAASTIFQVQVHKDGLTIPEPFIWKRAEVIRVLDSGYSFKTIIWNSTTEQWSRGAPVRKFWVGDVCFLKILRDNTEKDDLGNLPSF